MITIRNMKIAALIISVLLMSGFVPNEILAATNMKVGDYVQFGTYSGKPILWRVINIDDSGSPMLFSESVLCQKDYNIQNGIANWEESSIRRWLNSSEKTIKPENEYDEQEPGFLSNFTKEEQNAIQLAPRKSILSKETESRDGGTELYKYDEQTTGIFPNKKTYYSYNEKNYEIAYYKLVPDKVCLLSEKEINDAEKVLKGRKLGDNEYAIFRDKEDSYWLRTPYVPSGGSSEIYVKPGGNMDYSGLSYHNKLGIAPAINLRTAVYKSGTGFVNDPYIPKIDSTGSASFIIVVNSKGLKLSSSPYLKGNVPMLPAKAVLEAAGAKVVVSGNKLTATRGSKKVILSVNEIKASLHGKNSVLESKVISQNSIVFAPLKLVIKALGGTYVWDSAKMEVTIKLP